MQKNPITSNFKNLSLYIIFWIVLTLSYFLFLVYATKINLNIAIIDSLVFNIILCELGFSFWYPVNGITFEDYPASRIILNHAIGGIIAALIWLASGYAIIVLIFKVDNYSQFFFDTLPWRFFIGILFYGVISALYYVLIYYNQLQENITKESQLKNLITEAELKTLKFQINPHFIFNSLNSMSALTSIDPEKAREMILKLSDFLRYSLANIERKTNKLSEELANVKLYLDIEKIRFEDKFEYIENVTEDCKKASVPSMILQPLFENAIKHAVYETLDKVTLKLNCQKDGKYLRISVENNFDEESNNKKGAGIGLMNIQNRLELFYNQTNLMKVSNGNNYYRVDLFIPIH